MSLCQPSPHSQSYGFPNSHVWMWELDHKETWVLKNQCFRTVMLEKTLESPLNCKGIKQVNPKGNQLWIFTEVLMLNVKHQYFGCLMRRADSLEKTDAGKGKGGGRRWHGWMALLTQWTWICAHSGRQWRTGKPGVLQSMWSQRVGHDSVTEQLQQSSI